MLLGGRKRKPDRPSGKPDVGDTMNVTRQWLIGCWVIIGTILALWVLASAQRDVRDAFLERDRAELAYYDAVRWSYLCGKAEDRGIQEGYKLGRSVVNHPRETRFNNVGEYRFVGCGWR